LEKLNELKYNNISSFDNLFDKKAVVKEFYKEYREKLEKLVNSIKNIKKERDYQRYAQVILYRLIFLHFVQTKRFLSDDKNYLLTKFFETEKQKKNFYNDFLKFLFFDVLNKRIRDRQSLMHSDFLEIPYLNGGLFGEHRIEQDNPSIWIGNDIFYEILTFLSQWVWYVDESADYGEDRSISPEVLGHIFEKTINNQKEKGAYYTPSEVTNYIAENSILRYCIDKVNEKFLTNYSSIKDLFVSNEHTKFLYLSIIKNISILDNACGSGAFLLAAQKLLFDIYSRSWEIIKILEGPEIKKEIKAIGTFKSETYYFKRIIITNNIYGTDLEEGAVEICKLRLYLMMVSEIDGKNVEPLPNIDYNIVVGNSIVGFIDEPVDEQHLIQDNKRVKDILTEIDSLRKDFKRETDPTIAKNLKRIIDQKIDKYKKVLNQKLAADYIKYGLGLSENEIANSDPIHWRLIFSHIFYEGNSFDIIIGNPPYVESKKVCYPIDSFCTKKCGNIYAYFFENSFKLLERGGYIGFILPISSISTDRMIPLQELLISKSSDLIISSYDNRPSHIFQDIENIRYAIIFCKRKKNFEKTRIFTSKYNRWYSNEWTNLFKKISYIESTPLIEPGIIPKIHTHLEFDLLKILRRGPKLKKYFNSEATNKIWYHDAPRYWIRATNFIPKFKSKDVEISSHIKELSIIGDEVIVKKIIAVLNSSLFYWFFIISSNCRDFTKREIENFNIDLDGMSINNSNTIINLADKLMIDYQKNSLDKVNNRKTGKVIYQEFYPKKSKNIIDQIDDVLSDHLGFSKEQNEFIKAFDLRFRMGDEDSDQ
jgi:Eco57I restriction-modification methylase